ncbi:MAG: hypothetical protein GYB67_10675 [Chloroflexi bacterium]|nr:hypothetical protein [Chloroflexota bacterium]
METILRILSFALGAYIVWVTIISAIKTFILPRNYNVLLTRVVHQSLFALFAFPARRAATFERRDKIMSLYAPVTLFVLPFVLLICIHIGFVFMYLAIEPLSLYQAFRLSGSSLLTLGFSMQDTPGALLLEFAEAAIGMIMVALLIAYLPTMYSAFSRREMMVAKLEVRAGAPPSAVEMIARIVRARGIDYLGEMWEPWEDWFTEIEESHTSFSILVFFRSPQPNRSWVSAAGTILDSAALIESTVDIPFNVQCALTIRAGFIALRHIANFFNIPYDPAPNPDDPISISREEFDDACAQLEAEGVPLVEDRDQAWRDFAGWRVNYDRVLLALAALTMAPYAPWVSDRSLPRGLVKSAVNGRGRETLEV